MAESVNDLRHRPNNAVMTESQSSVLFEVVDEPQKGPPPAAPSRFQKHFGRVTGPLARHWNDFCAHTGLCGFYYMTPGVHRFRRIIWYLISITFACLTIYMITNIFLGYQDNPIKTDQSREYRSTLPFPEIMICNTMPFRVSNVEPYSDMHYTLSALYKTPHLLLENSTTVDVKRIKRTLSNVPNSREFFQVAAHQKEDMIVSCRWKGEKCSAENFTTVYTEVGICYDFNTADTPLDVQYAGKDNGLQLVLNVATYEQMNGPYETLGALVAFFSQTEPASTRRAVNTLIGHYTSISLTTKVATFIEGNTCKKGKLNFFTDYTREACMYEALFKQVIDECGCYPYLINEELIANHSELVLGKKQCNLHQSLLCAQPILEKTKHSEEENSTAANSGDDCMQECQQTTFTPTISTAKAAWDRILAGFDNVDEVTEKAKRQVKKASEISKRYRPDNNATMVERFDNLYGAMKNWTDFAYLVNNLSISAFPEITGLSAVTAFADTHASFKTKTYAQGIASIEKQFQAINASILATIDAFSNDTITPFLLDHTKRLNETKHKPDLSQETFSVVKFEVYLNTISAILQALDTLKKAKLSIQQGVIDAYFVGGESLLLHNDSLALNSTVGRFLLLGTRPVGVDESLLNVTTNASQPAADEKPPGCLQKAFNFSLLSGHKRPTGAASSTPDYLLDVFLCVLHRYTSPNTKVNLAALVAEYIDIIPVSAVDPDSQETICSTVICRNFAGVSAPKCGLKDKEYVQIIHDALHAISGAMDGCIASLNEAKHEISQMHENYDNYILPTFADSVKAAQDYVKNRAKLHDAFANTLLPDGDMMQQLDGNVTAYQLKDVPYESFSTNISKNFVNFVEKTFVIDMSKAKATLVDVVTSLKDMTHELEHLLNVSYNEPDEHKNGVFSIVTKKLLWINHTHDSLDASLVAIDALRNATVPLVPQFDPLTSTLSNTFSPIKDDARLFLESINIKPRFFEDNFIIVNIYMADLSVETITQSKALQFFNLIADLGGAASFWFGLCMVNFLEIADLIIRYTLFVCRKGATRVHKKVLSHRQMKMSVIDQMRQAAAAGPQPANGGGRDTESYRWS